MLRLNVGCGLDYRDGFVNIDGSSALPRVDQVIDLRRKRLTEEFADESVDFILCNDFLEHHFHWEAVDILRDCYAILTPGGAMEIRVPDFEYIVRSRRYPMTSKLTMLYGGQDIPQGKGDDVSREEYPDFFCHKYGYTRKTMKAELERIGFRSVRSTRAATNFITLASRPSR